MSNIELLDSLHTKILYSKLAETITEQEIIAFIDYKEQMKRTYNQALDDCCNVLRQCWLNGTVANRIIKEQIAGIEKLKR